LSAGWIGERQLPCRPSRLGTPQQAAFEVEVVPLGPEQFAVPLAGEGEQQPIALVLAPDVALPDVVALDRLQQMGKFALIKYVRQRLRCCFCFLVENEYLDRNPELVLRTPKKRDTTRTRRGNPRRDPRDQGVRLALWVCQSGSRQGGECNRAEGDEDGNECLRGLALDVRD
jgi:hypothetical protein